MMLMVCSEASRTESAAYFAAAWVLLGYQSQGTPDYFQDNISGNPLVGLDVQIVDDDSLVRRRLERQLPGSGVRDANSRRTGTLDVSCL